MAFNYVVTANRATAVNQSLRGNFTGPEDINLITAKLSRIEISKVTPDGLKVMQEIGIYGRIEALRLFRPKGYNKDLLFLLTHRYHVAILECVEGEQPDTLDIITRRSGNIADNASRTAEAGNIVIIDPDCKVIGLRLYDGLFKIIPIDDLNFTYGTKNGFPIKDNHHNFHHHHNQCGDLEAYNIRMEENMASDIAFLHGFSNPTIGFIWKKENDPDKPSSHVRTYEISMKEKDFIQGPWDKEDVANEANLIIPVPLPFGGAIIIALESIVYICGNHAIVIAPPEIKQCPINCYTPIDDNGSRYLLADFSGRLFVLILEPAPKTEGSTSNRFGVNMLKLQLLGRISTPDSITYLDNAIVYVGSKLADSQLIKLLEHPDSNGECIQICETFNNLGPIVDMCLVDLEKQGQGQLVTCSGHHREGSLRIIRNGIGIDEHASMELPNIKGVWSLKIGKDQVKDNYLLLTFVQDSYLWLCEDGGDFDNNLDDDGFDRGNRTVLCANVDHEQIIQVTRSSIRLICAITKKLIFKWDLPSDNGIYKVSNNHDQVVCADGKKIYFFEIQKGNLNLVKKTELEAEIACFDITPLNEHKRLLSVAFWFNQVIVIYSLPDIKELHREPLNNEMIPRSIVTAMLEDSCYLLCALGDGSVYYYNFNPETGAMSNSKKVTLGTYETILKPFKSQSTTSIFACSDRPTVIYSSNNKLVFSNVNLKEVLHMCSLDTVCYPDSLALVSDTDIQFGTIDEIQKLHIRTKPLHESPLRISHQPTTQTFGLITSRRDRLDGTTDSVSTSCLNKSYALSMTTGQIKPTSQPLTESNEIDITSFLIIDSNFNVLHSHQMMPTERAVSVLSCNFGDPTEEYYILGSSFVNADEPEPKNGRLTVFKWTQDNNLQQVAETAIKGCPYSLCEFDGRKFLVGINATVNLFELNSRRDLHIECTFSNAVMALYLKRSGNMIVMGDIMRSITVFEYKPINSHFEEIARDIDPAWMTEIEILDFVTYMGADDKFNIFVCQRDPKALTEQDRAANTMQQMSHVGAFHFGDAINVAVPGTLVVQHPSESSIEILHTTLFGTISGVIGMILTIDVTLFNILKKVQDSLCKHIKSVGKIDHGEWRAKMGYKSSLPSFGFIDGDLVETFLDLSKEKMALVAKDAELPVDDLIKTLEELSRLH